VAFTEIELNIVGVAPTVMHNGQLADPLNRFAKALKAITGKRKKTDDDYEEMARLEFLGGLYVDTNGNPCWPGECIESMFKSAARMSKLGKQVERGLWCNGDWPLAYKGPKDADALWADERFRLTVGAKNPGSGSRIMRTRPIFRDWSLSFVIQFDPECLNESQVREFCETAGKYVGLSDFRPRYGRFALA
jgi:hypothetical protein